MPSGIIRAKEYARARAIQYARDEIERAISKREYWRSKNGWWILERALRDLIESNSSRNDPDLMAGLWSELNDLAKNKEAQQRSMYDRNRQRRRGYRRSPPRAVDDRRRRDDERRYDRRDRYEDRRDPPPRRLSRERFDDRRDPPPRRLSRERFDDRRDSPPRRLSRERDQRNGEISDGEESGEISSEGSASMNDGDGVQGEIDEEVEAENEEEDGDLEASGSSEGFHEEGWETD
jgi:hypothetical protein